MNEQQIRDLAEHALHAACRHIQHALGVTTGDAAGFYFSGSVREAIESQFAEYIRIELSFARITQAEIPVALRETHPPAVKNTSLQLCQLEFPSYPLPGFDPAQFGLTNDTSWHNDVCPSHETPDGEWRLCVDHLHPEQRKIRGGYRFSVQHQDQETGDIIIVVGCETAAEIVGFLENPHWRLAYKETQLVSERSHEFDAIEIHGIRGHHLKDDPHGTCRCEQDDANPQFFAVFLHLKTGGIECVGDFAHLQMARSFAETLSKQYGWEIDDATRAVVHAVDLPIEHTGGGCCNYRIEMPDGKHYVMVTDSDGSHLPQYPEIETMMIGLYDEKEEEMLYLIVTGRIGLNVWYEQTVGYKHDEEKEPLPLAELIKAVAKMAFRHKTGYAG